MYEEMFEIACKTFTIDDLLRCSYNLNKNELRVLRYLLQNGKADVKEISSKLNLERSTVQKILSKLLEKKLVSRMQINLHKGYKYYYVVKNPNEIKKEVMALLDRWYERAKNVLNTWI